MRNATHVLVIIFLFAFGAFAGPQPEIQEVRFPDTNLDRVVRQELSSMRMPTNRIYDSAAIKIKDLNAGSASIADAAGIEALTGLQNLYCFNNKFASLNVSACTNLHLLYCHNNRLTNLNVSACAHLSQLYCYSNNLTDLNISANKALTQVYAHGNPLTNIVVWWTPPAMSNKPSTLILYYDGNPAMSNPR